MSKFLSQRRKKRKFYGNRFTNNQRVNDEELEVVESTSSGSVAGLSQEYVRLSEDNLLKKCPHGKTQNQNESLNGMV